MSTLSELFGSYFAFLLQKRRFFNVLWPFLGHTRWPKINGKHESKKSFSSPRQKFEQQEGPSGIFEFHFLDRLVFCVIGSKNDVFLLFLVIFCVFDSKTTIYLKPQLRNHLPSIPNINFCILLSNFDHEFQGNPINYTRKEYI